MRSKKITIYDNNVYHGNYDYFLLSDFQKASEERSRADGPRDEAVTVKRGSTHTNIE